MYYVIDNQMCVVCNRVADMPTPGVRRFGVHALVAARRFG